MIITSFYSFLLIDLQSYKLFKFMQIFCRRKKTQKHHQRDGSFDGITTYTINTQTITSAPIAHKIAQSHRFGYLLRQCHSEENVGILRVILVVENEIPWEIPRFFVGGAITLCHSKKN